MERNGWTTMTETTLKGGYFVCGTASDVDSNSASSKYSLVGDGTGSTSEEFPTNKTSTTSATEGISTSKPLGSTNNSLLPPQSKVNTKPLDDVPKPTRTTRSNRRYRPRRGNYLPTTSSNAPKHGFPGQLIPRANIPRTSGDITDASTLLRLFPDVLQNKSTAEIEKWVETCKEYGHKVYDQEEPPGMPGRGQRMRDETESGASARDPTNKQHPSAIQHMPIAEHRQNHNGHDDFQDTDNDDDISYDPDMSSQRPNQY